jgi:hypothetical protein
MVYNANLFNTDPYWDDFDENKNFLRMLFSPGRAVQARELTQLQTIIQDQINKFGNHVFTDGSRVIGGEISNQDATFLRVNVNDPTNTSTATNIQSLIGTEIVTSQATTTDTRRAKVLYGITGATSDNDNYYMLMVQYMDGGSDAGPQWGEGETVKGVSGSDTYLAQVASTEGNADTDATFVNGVTGTAKLTTTKDGIFFVKGHFIKSDFQSSSPYGLTGANTNIRDFGTPTSRVGFDIQESIVEHTDDYTLRDPSSGSYNYNAPGADRYKITLKLDFKNFVNSATYGVSGFGDANFVDLVRYVDGQVVGTSKYTDYSQIEKTLARRTYDESGSYTTKPFEIDLRESLSNLGGPYTETEGGSATKLAAGLQPGKAYVFGYEFENQSTEYVLLDKARTTTTLTNQPLNDVKFGQYVVVGCSGDTGGFTQGVDISTTYPKILLTGSGGATGTARVRQLVPNNDNFGGTGMSSGAQTYNMYLFDIGLGGITAFGNVKNLGGTGALGEGGVTASFKIAAGYTNATNGWGARVYNPSLATSVFPMPVGKSISSVSNLNYRIYKGYAKFTHVAGTPKVITTGSDTMTFVGAVDNSNAIMHTDVRDNYFILGGPTGERLDTDNVLFALSTDKKTLTIGSATDAAKQLPSGEWTIWTTIDVTNGGYRKKTRTNSATYTYASDGGENSSLSGDTGGYYIPVGNSHIDIIDVSSVSDNNNTVKQALSLPTSEVKSGFLLDNGQRDNHYDFGRLYLKPDLGVSGITGTVNLTITYDYFAHDSGDGPFVVNSYTHSGSGFTFDNIPIYTSPTTGKSFSLRNCIDFRGTAQSDGTIKNDGLNPKGSSTFTSTYDHHLSRIDKLVLTRDRKFDIIKGVPSLNPTTPPDRADAMTLYVITVPAYTYNLDDVITKYVENKRYTMRDIGSIEKRVENLEYYTSLSLLEQQTEARSFTDSNGNDIFKNGIMVDPFKGHSVGDVLNSDYKCSVDYENGHLRPPFTSKGLDLENTSYTGLTITPDGVAMLNPTLLEGFVWQPFSSDYISVNPYNVPNFMGYVNFNDPFDNWYDQTNKPTVKINSQGENDRWKVKNENTSYGFGTQWNDWETLWSGRNITESDLYNNRGRDFLSDFTTASLSANIQQRIGLASDAAIRSTETLKNNEGRSGIRVRRLPERLEKLVNDRLVDVSVVPYTRGKTVTFSAFGLKPNTTVYPFFDGENVSTYCGPNGGASGAGITTGAEGTITDAFFSIPDQTEGGIEGFYSGERLFRLTDSPNDTLSETTTAADGIYYAQGIVQQSEGSLLSTRPIISRRNVVNDNAIVRDSFDRDIYIDTSSNNLWIDPLAQSFTINRNDHDAGVLLHSIDLFFRDRSSTAPITLEIRPTINGYPHLSKVLPFSSVTLIPDASEVRTDYPVDTTYTRFEFSTPVYCPPGEYTFCLRTSSADYRLYEATIGAADLSNSATVCEQPHIGALFTPQNNGLSVLNQNKSLKFRINRCHFETTEGSLISKVPSTEFTEELGSSGITCDVFKVTSGEIIPQNTTLTHTSTVGSVSPSIVTNENIYLETAQTIDEVNDFQLDTSFKTTTDEMSPVMDIKRLDLILVSNTINNSTAVGSNGELNANANSSDGDNYPDGGELTAGSAARYITRRVTLADGFESSNFKVLMGVNKPAEATVQVFIKPLAEETETAFEDVGYTQLTADSTIPDAGNDYDFTDVTFSLSSAFTEPIKTFAVKICMYSSSTTKVPTVKDFRTIALNG